MGRRGSFLGDGPFEGMLVLWRLCAAETPADWLAGLGLCPFLVPALSIYCYLLQTLDALAPNALTFLPPRTCFLSRRRGWPPGLLLAELCGRCGGVPLRPLYGACGGWSSAAGHCG